MAWTLFSFAHFFRWTVLPLACGVALLTCLRPSDMAINERRSTRFLDVGLALSLVAIALQLIPLTPWVRDGLAPAVGAYDRAMRFDTATRAAGPLSIDPGATLLALVFGATIVVLFWCLRRMFGRGGIRTTIRAVAWIGLLVSPLAIVHHVIPLPGFDLVWGLTSRGLRPYGPFVNRNDFAGWLIMAIPLTLGYAFARIQSRHRSGEALDTEVAFDNKSIWLGLAICLMLAGLLFSLSRSGLLGALVGFLFFAWRSRRQMTAHRAKLAALAIAVILATAATYADMGAFATRLEGTFSEGVTGRFSIWRQTWPVVRDFWPLGTGVGTYQAVMVLYQTMSRFYYITHADNEFLQILTEGGLLLGIPVAMTLVAGIRLVVKRLREDQTATFWIRAGATAGMLSIATQNMVEMTLRVPANAVLFAILAAIAVHHRAVHEPAMLDLTMPPPEK